MSRPMTQQEAMDIVYKLMKDPHRTANEIIALSMGMNALHIELDNGGIASRCEGEFSVLYALYIESRVGFEIEQRIIYIGTREYAQDLTGDLIRVGDGRLTPTSFTLEEIITVDGIVVSQQAIDI